MSTSRSIKCVCGHLRVSHILGSLREPNVCRIELCKCSNFVMAEHNDEPPTKLTRAEDEHEEQVGREIRVRNNVIAELESKLATAEAERDVAKGRIKGWIERVARLSVEHMEELTQLEKQVERLTTEHEKDGQAWMAENTELLTQIERLTVERDDLKERLRTTRLEQAAKAFQVDELETKVERLTAQVAATDAKF